MCGGSWLNSIYITEDACSELKYRLLYRDDSVVTPGDTPEALKVYSGTDYTIDEASGELIVNFSSDILRIRKIKHSL